MRMLLAVGGTFVAAVTLATGCGGSGGDTMRATLTDDGCVYEGDTSPAPGLLNIQVDNQTLHFAWFGIWKLAPGKSTEDVQHAYMQALADFKRTHMPPNRAFTEGLYEPGAGGSAQTDPRATSSLPLHEFSGRFVIVCFEESSVDTRTSSSSFVPPSAAYVIPSEIDIGSER
jgi:hypothetical protein